MARWFVDRSPRTGIPSVSLRSLLPDARFLGCPDLLVSGCSADSRRLEPGQVFVALRGRRRDGHDFVGRALERGAAAVVVEHPCPDAGPLQVIVPDARHAYGRLCQALAGEPAATLRVVGVTGATGRTATSLFLRSIFEADGDRFGVVGALGWSDGVNAHPSGATAPGAEGLAAMLAAMVERGCAGGAIELDADALERRHAEGIAFDGAIVTDVAGPLAEPVERLRDRRRSQARLFRMVAPGGTAVVNADDPEADLLGAVNLEARRVSFALGRPADVTAHIDRLDGNGTRFRLRGFDREATVALALVGTRSVSHALAAAALAWSRGLDAGAVVAGLEAVARVPGRLEPVAEGQDFDVRIDRARTELELREALAAVREVCPGRVHCVLGAGGDPGALPGLARAAEAGANQTILTLDDLLYSEPDALLDTALAAVRRPGRVRVEPDRRRAVEAALSQARPGDAVLIAGQGIHSLPSRPSRPLPGGDRAIIAHWLHSRSQAPRRRSA
jgi:UDP-N-acetylmuramoyl-L-alanyl-D-glutamate--2,6-diaminopimelate ligase